MIKFLNDYYHGDPASIGIVKISCSDGRTFSSLVVVFGWDFEMTSEDEAMFMENARRDCAAQGGDPA